MNDLEADLLIANAKIKQLEQQLADMTSQGAGGGERYRKNDEDLREGGLPFLR